MCHLSGRVPFSCMHNCTQSNSIVYEASIITRLHSPVLCHLIWKWWKWMSMGTMMCAMKGVVLFSEPGYSTIQIFVVQHFSTSHSLQIWVYFSPVIGPIPDINLPACPPTPLLPHHQCRGGSCGSCGERCAQM